MRLTWPATVILCQPQPPFLYPLPVTLLPLPAFPCIPTLYFPLPPLHHLPFFFFSIFHPQTTPFPTHFFYAVWFNFYADPHNPLNTFLMLSQFFTTFLTNTFLPFPCMLVLSCRHLTESHSLVRGGVRSCLKVSFHCDTALLQIPSALPCLACSLASALLIGTPEGWRVAACLFISLLYREEWASLWV